MSETKSILPINVFDDHELYNYVTGNPYSYRSNAGWEQLELDPDLARSLRRTVSHSNVDGSSLSSSTKWSRRSRNHQRKFKQQTYLNKFNWVMVLYAVVLHFIISLRLRWRYLAGLNTLFVFFFYLFVVYGSLFIASMEIREFTKNITLDFDDKGILDVYHENVYRPSPASDERSSLVMSYVTEAKKTEDKLIRLHALKQFYDAKFTSCKNLQIGANFFTASDARQSPGIWAEALYRSRNRLGRLLSVGSIMRAVECHLTDRPSQANQWHRKLTIDVQPVPFSRCAKAAFFKDIHEAIISIVAASVGYASLFLTVVFTFDRIDGRRAGFEHMLSQINDRSLLPLAASFSLDVAWYCVAVGIAWSVQFLTDQWLAYPITISTFGYALPALLMVYVLQRCFQSKTSFCIYLLLVHGPLVVGSFIHVKKFRMPHPVNTFLRLVSPTYNLMAAVRHSLLFSQWEKLCHVNFGQRCDWATISDTCRHLLCREESDTPCVWSIQVFSEYVQLTIQVIQWAALFLVFFVLGKIPQIVRFYHRASSQRRSITGPVQRESSGQPGLTIKAKNVNVEGEELSIDRLNLHLLPGDCLTLMGKKDSGNSLLLKLIAGIRKPSVGTLSVSQEYWQPQDHSPLWSCYCPRENWLHPYLTGRETLMFLTLLQSSKADDHHRVEELLSDLDPDDEADELVVNMSESSQRLIHVACVLAASPKLVLMDHPTGGMTWFQKLLVWNSIHAMKARGHVFVIASNCGEESSLLGSQCIVMVNGSLSLNMTHQEIEEFNTGMHVYVWTAHSADGTPRSMVPLLKELQRAFRKGTYAIVQDAREHCVVFPFIRIATEPELAKIFETMETCKERGLLGRYSVQTTTPKHVLEAYQEHWLQY